VLVAKCTTERLMKLQGIQGARRGKAYKSIINEDLADRPGDLVNREFVTDRPNQLWVADITYVRTWAGWIFTAFVIDVFNCSIVGWKTSTSIKTGLALNALEQAIHDRDINKPLIHHSDRGVQYLSIKYRERLAEAGLTGLVGTKGDSYDNA
jgi:putative transposase